MRVRDEVKAAHEKRDYLLSNYVEQEGPIPNSPCWIWTRALNDTGYGCVQFSRLSYRAHRLMWILANGPIPDGLLCLHKCNEPLCGNPEHLYLGDEQDNAKYMWECGRAYHAFGSRSGNTSLTETDVAEILELANQGKSNVSIARKFRVSETIVANIVRGETWLHVAGPRQKPRTKKSRFIGVTLHGTRWEASVSRTVYLGKFGFEVDAAIARNYWDAYHGRPLPNEIPPDEMYHD